MIDTLRRKNAIEQLVSDVQGGRTADIETALVELAEMIAAQDDAIVELAELIGE